jgi:hypothetical protein
MVSWRPEILGRNEYGGTATNGKIPADYNELGLRKLPERFNITRISSTASSRSNAMRFDCRQK